MKFFLFFVFAVFLTAIFGWLEYSLVFADDEYAQSLANFVDQPHDELVEIISQYKFAIVLKRVIMLVPFFFVYSIFHLYYLMRKSVVASDIFLVFFKSVIFSSIFSMVVLMVFYNLDLVEYDGGNYIFSTLGTFDSVLNNTVFSAYFLALVFSIVFFEKIMQNGIFVLKSRMLFLHVFVVFVLFSLSSVL